MITQILLTILHEKPIDDLTDKVAGRAYTLQHVQDVTAEIVEDKPEPDLKWPKLIGYK